MQNTGYIIDRKTNEKVKVLARFSSSSAFQRTGIGVYFRLRKTGKNGTHFTSEEEYLNLPENENLLTDLKNGKTIGL